MEPNFWLMLALVLCIVSSVVAIIERAIPLALLAAGVAALSVYFLAI